MLVIVVFSRRVTGLVNTFDTSSNTLQNKAKTYCEAASEASTAIRETLSWSALFMSHEEPKTVCFPK
jgi:hypothetical protein